MPDPKPMIHNAFSGSRRSFTILILLALASSSSAGTICGHITDADTGQPVPGAGVFVREPAGLYAGALAVSASDGAWCIDGLVAGTYTLEFRVDDYVTAYVNGVVVTGSASDVPVALSRSPLVFDPPWPNPASGSVSLKLHVTRPTPVDVRIFDARGRLVQAWAADTVETGTREYAWDGRDVTGRPAPAGLYLVRVDSGATQTTRPLMLTR